MDFKPEVSASHSEAATAAALSILGFEPHPSSGCA
jgi:hypothetical protein